MTISDTTKEAFGRLVHPKQFQDMHDVVLLECTDAITGLPVPVVCAILKKGDGVDTVPLAIMTSPDIRQRLIPPVELEFN